jgi:hypothetical protein
MGDELAAFVSDLIGRLHGPFSFRFVLQPVMAAIYAIRDGLADSRASRPPYLWTIFTRSDRRWELLRDGWKAVTRVLALGAIMDTLYQLIVLHSIHPSELAVIVLGLAFVPYVLTRGPIERIVTWWRIRHIHTRPRSLGRETHT